MLARWCFVILLILLVCGCALGHTQTYTIQNPADFTEWQRLEMHRAAVKWNSVLVYKSVKIIDKEGTWKIVRTDKLPGLAIGWTDAPSHTISYKKDISDDYYFVVSLHEMGHSLGLQHITADGVMNPTVYPTVTDFSAADMAECRRAGAC